MHDNNKHRILQTQARFAKETKATSFKHRMTFGGPCHISIWQWTGKKVQKLFKHSMVHAASSRL